MAQRSEKRSKTRDIFNVPQEPCGCLLCRGEIEAMPGWYALFLFFLSVFVLFTQRFPLKEGSIDCVAQFASKSAPISKVVPLGFALRFYQYAPNSTQLVSYEELAQKSARCALAQQKSLHAIVRCRKRQESFPSFLSLLFFSLFLCPPQRVE
jgi:hypothetical protein